MRVRDAGMRCNVGSESQLRMTGDKLIPALRGNPYNVYILGAAHSNWFTVDIEGWRGKKKKQGPLFKIVMISFPLFKGFGQLAMYINPYYILGR